MLGKDREEYIVRGQIYFRQSCILISSLSQDKMYMNRSIIVKPKRIGYIII